jgi:DNA topoisomerase-1
LWRKIYKGLSAGRVQSVAVRLVVEREREIDAFQAVEYWSIEADLTKGKSQPFTAYLIEADGKKVEKLTIGHEKDAQAFIDQLEGAKYKVLSVETKQERRQPAPPFTTSTLQQESSRRFGWSAKQTMRVAQVLYEAGHITYMRTDSLNISESAIAATRQYIKEAMGDKYLHPAGRRYKAKTKGAQEAHEAIRPTYPSKTPEALSLRDSREVKLYDLIWRRLIACQMAEAIYNNTSANIEARAKNNFVFRATGIEVVFDGWRKVYYTKKDQGEAKILPELDKGDALTLEQLRHEQHFTEPPARYSEASLIKALEERGIGRPSTYAPTMSTIIDRGYVHKEKGRLHPQEVGMMVNDLLVKHFPEVIDYDFTARVEEELDSVAAGQLLWSKVVAGIYVPLAKQIGTEEKKIEKIDTNIKTDEKCPECGKPIVIKRGKFGQFYACTGFPECRYTKPFLTEAEEALKDKAEARAKEGKCPKCQAELVARKGKFGWFVGCSTYPKCKFIENVK